MNDKTQKHLARESAWRLLKTTFLLVLWTCSCILSTARSQERAVITGKIVDAETKAPIPFVNVVIKDSPFGAATDTAGEFKIQNVIPELYVMEFRHVAYKKRFHVLRIEPGERIVLSIELLPELVRLDEVSVTEEAETVRRVHQSHASTTITAEQIKKSGATRLTDVLHSFEPGTQPSRLRRGLDREPYIIYLDGAYVQYIPGSLDMIVEVNQIERIEISRWVGAAPNAGPGTSDRVMHIYTKRPR